MITEIQYSKDFISKTGYKPAGNHGYPPESFYQQISDDEQNLREEVVEKFALNKKSAMKEFNYIIKLFQKCNENIKDISFENNIENRTDKQIKRMLKENNVNYKDYIKIKN